MKIDKQTVKLISEKMEVALREVAQELDLEVEVRGGTYDSAGTFNPRVVFKTKDADATEFRRYAELFDLSPDDYGSEFTSQGKTFRVSGIAPRSSVRPILAVEVASGKTYKFPSDAVARALKARAS